MSKIALLMISSSLHTLVLTIYRKNKFFNQKLSSSSIFARTFWIHLDPTASSFLSTMKLPGKCLLSVRSTNAKESTEECQKHSILIWIKSLRWIRILNKIAKSHIQSNLMRMFNLLRFCNWEKSNSNLPFLLKSGLMLIEFHTVSSNYCLKFPRRSPKKKLKRSTPSSLAIFLAFSGNHNFTFSTLMHRWMFNTWLNL